jgi:hypothetical protein
MLNLLARLHSPVDADERGTGQDDNRGQSDQCECEEEASAEGSQAEGIHSDATSHH